MADGLYRDPSNGKLGGVCAGFAAYLGAEIWLVRILVVSAFLLGGGLLVVMAYLAACLFLDKVPIEHVQQASFVRGHKMKNKPWQAGQAPGELLKQLDGELSEMEGKLRNMEAYVTSSSFKVHREFKHL